MPHFSIEALPLLIVFLGFLVLGIAGFGSALIIVPVLAWQWPLSFVVPLVLLIEIPATLLHTGINFQRVVWRELPGLLPAALVGAVAGLALVRLTPGAWLQIVLGGYVIFIGLKGYWGRAKVEPAPNGARLPAGFLMGLVEAMFGTSGPVVMAWLVRRIADPQQLRATMPATLIALSSIAILGSGLSGGLSQPLLWRWFAMLLPAALLGIFCGHVVAMRLKPALLTPIIFGLLVVSGAVLSLGALVRTTSLFS